MHVVVVGAGVVGASTAYHLARDGVHVTLVDDQRAGQATAAGAGIVGPWLSMHEDPTWQRLAYHAAADYARLVEELAAAGETDVGYARVGALVVREHESDLDPVEERLRHRAEQRPELGAIRRLAQGEAAGLFPPLAEHFHAIHVEGAARVDGRMVRAALLRVAGQHGVVSLQQQADLRITARGVQVLASDATMTPDAVVLAAGAWSARLLHRWGYDPPLSPERGQILHLHLHHAADQTARWPLVFPPAGGYLLGFDGGRVVAGATREPVGFDARATAAGVAQLLESALAVAPGLGDASVTEVRVGLRPSTDDGYPLLGPLPDVNNLVLATGLGATGLTIGPYLGYLAARMVTGQDPDIEPTPWRPDRPRSS